MKMSEVQSVTLKDQRAIMQKIVTRRMKIAALQEEIDFLQEDLNDVASIVAARWDGIENSDAGLFSSEHLSAVPFPTVVPEKIRVGAFGMTSSFDPQEIL